MISIERQNNILDLLKEKSPLSVRALSKKLFVSEATIRRDLNEMEKLILIKRVHGGAMLIEKESEEVGLDFRMAEFSKEKEKIALLALPYIKSAKSIYMDSSSTVNSLANHLKTQYSNIFTNSIQIAHNLAKNETNNIILLGGNVSYGNNSVTGEITLELLSRYNFDLAIMSCAGIDKDFYATEKKIENCAIKQQVLKRASVKILLIDSSKFSLTNTCKICPIEEFDYLITDKKPSTEFLMNFSDTKLKIIY